MAMRAYQNVSAEEKAWAYHLSMDRAEADYWNGLELAREDGIRQGLEKGIKLGLRNLMDSMAWTAAQAMDAMKIPESERGKYEAMLTRG
jgi:hypothetical protein